MKPVLPHVFKALQDLDIPTLTSRSTLEIRPIIPCLVRMALISPLDITQTCADAKKDILTLLSGTDLVNFIVSLLSVDFTSLEVEIKKEQQMRQSSGSSPESQLIQGLNIGLSNDFEQSDSTKRLRIVMSELLQMQAQLREYHQNKNANVDCIIKPSELFDNEVYLEEISDVISICLAELPNILNICEVSEILLHVNKGPMIISWVVSNMPDALQEVVESLVLNAERGEEWGIRGRALAALCAMCPPVAAGVRAKAAAASRLPALVIYLTLTHHQDDLVSFMSGLLLGSDQTTRAWFATFLRNSHKRAKGDGHTALTRLRQELLNRLKEATAGVEASALLRLYCALRGIAGIKFHDDEVSGLLRLVTQKPPPTPVGVRFVSLSLCMIIACPSLMAATEHEKRAIEWVQWLVKEEAYFASTSGVTASFGEMLLLIAIHFHSGQLPAVGELVCATLGMRIPVRPNALARIKQAFTQEIFTEQVVTAHAVKVPVTENLSSNVPGYLPVHCIHQLLKSRAFSKHKVPIKNWIYRQICDCTSPLHPVMPALVEVYVNSILMLNTKGGYEYVNKPITEEEISRVFRNSIFGDNFDARRKPFSTADDEGSETFTKKKPTLASQLLLLYYLLLYEDIRLANAATLAGRKVKSYSSAFLSELPIKYLLHQAQKDQMSYGGLFSPLLRLLATHFPQLSLVDDWMDDQIFGDTCKHYIDVNLSKMLIVDAFRDIEDNPYKAVKVLKAMLNMNPTAIWPFAKRFVHYFKNVLSDKVPRHIQELYREVWLRLNTVLPRCLWVMTINALLDISFTKSVTVTQENVLVDPLQVLRCDLRVFRCGPILKIILRILEASLAASRSQLSRHLLDKPLLEKNGQLTSDAEREELKTALIAAQESAALQILLEACLETPEDRSKPEMLWSLREVRSVICSFLHQVFISEPSLAKLVHFQGYPRELLPITVQGIPSMHICLDFIPELLSQASLEKQVYAIDLVSHLSVQYALPKAMSIARLCVNTLSTLLAVLPSDIRLELFQPVLPSLARICMAFPALLEDITSLLLQLGRVCESQASLGQCWNDVSISGDMAYVKSDVQPSSKVLVAEALCRDIKVTMSEIVEKALLNDKIY